MRVVAGMGVAGEGGGRRGAVECWVDEEEEEGKELEAGNGRQARFQALAAMEEEAVAIAGGPSLPRSSLLSPSLSLSLLFCFPCLCFSS